MVMRFVLVTLRMKELRSLLKRVCSTICLTALYGKLTALPHLVGPFLMHLQTLGKELMGLVEEGL